MVRGSFAGLSAPCFKLCLQLVSALLGLFTTLCALNFPACCLVVACWWFFPICVHIPNFSHLNSMVNWFDILDHLHSTVASVADVSWSGTFFCTFSLYSYASSLMNSSAKFFIFCFWSPAGTRTELIFLWALSIQLWGERNGRTKLYWLISFAASVPKGPVTVYLCPRFVLWRALPGIQRRQHNCILRMGKYCTGLIICEAQIFFFSSNIHISMVQYLQHRGANRIHWSYHLWNVLFSSQFSIPPKIVYAFDTGILHYALQKSLFFEPIFTFYWLPEIHISLWLRRDGFFH